MRRRFSDPRGLRGVYVVVIPRLLLVMGPGFESPRRLLESRDDWILATSKWGIATVHGGRRWWPSTVRAVLLRVAQPSKPVGMPSVTSHVDCWLPVCATCRGCSRETCHLSPGQRWRFVGVRGTGRSCNACSWRPRVPRLLFSHTRNSSSRPSPASARRGQALSEPVLAHRVAGVRL
jgi:hypothetical protein